MSVFTVGTETLMSCHGVTVVHRRGKAAVHALSDIEIEIRQGEHIGLLGPSGSGKTTLLHAIGGLIDPTSGMVRWRGKELSALDRSARGHASAPGIAYVFQGANLLPHLDAGENIAFAILAASRRARESHNGRSGEPEAPEDYLALVGLGGKARSLPADLSGGEKQRVAIARALAQRPEVLLCDEPTGQLDSDTGVRVLDLIDAAKEMFGFAMVVATHDPAVGRRADRTIELADGRLRERSRA